MTTHPAATTHPLSATSRSEDAIAHGFADAVRTAWRLTADLGQAEEAAGEAIANTWRCAQRKPITKPQAYLRRAVVNQVHSTFRRQRVEREHHARRSADHRGQRSVDDHVAESDEVARALSKLSVRQRRAVVLLYYNGLSHAEAAAVMGCAVGTVRSSHSRALKRLRTILGGDGG